MKRDLATRTSLGRPLFALLLLCTAVACGGGNKDTVTAHVAGELTPAQIDADPLALLPGQALGVATVDARAFYASKSLGSQVAQLTEKYIPLGEEAGFAASRDVDRVTVATYSTQGADACAVVSGKFDEQKIAQVAKNHTPTKGGGLLVESSYAGRTLYTVNNAGFTVLTPHTALAGTEAGIRRALDRIKDGRATRSITPWMLETVETKGAATAVALDFIGQPAAAAALGSVPVPWLKKLRAARILGNFEEPGMHIAGSFTYGQAEEAQAGADGLKDIINKASVLAFIGIIPKLQNLDIKVAASNVECKFAVDDQAMRALLVNIPKWSGG
jgi:hypothetical protein